ncbi:uncharacterized protein [Littorina saxatilis]|uniref:uncharacterized protein n=1 Tax=Littorina saxatilis TaxID=31220 RepID=UPI0038B6066D
MQGSTSHKSQHPASEMAEERRTNIRWTDVMDIELCQQAILVNPWKEGVTWKLLLVKLHDTLMKQRRKENAAELRGSGIVVPELTDLQKSLDELLELKDEAERRKRKVKAERKGEVAAEVQVQQQIQDAAMRTGGLRKLLTEEGEAKADESEEEVLLQERGQARQAAAANTVAVDTANAVAIAKKYEPVTPRGKKRDVLEYMKTRDDNEEKLRNGETERRKEIAREHRDLRMKELDERKLLTQQKLEHERREGEAQRMIRERELDNQKRELEIRKQEADNNSAMLKGMIEMLQQMKK